MTANAASPVAPPMPWPWLRPAMPALVLGVAAWALLFPTEIGRAVAVWNASTAYSHCWFVLPIALYLAWDRRAAAAAMPLRPVLWPVALAVPGALAWLAAERVGIMEGRQLVAVGLLDLLLLAVLGWRLAWVFSAALLYLFFLVPFGAFVTPVLQRFTAAFTDVGLDLLGIPYFMDHFTIEVPGGVFYIAEACAGLRFLIAAIAFGVLYACLLYTSPWRRLAFVALSCVVPIVANGFRALGIVVLGYLLGSAEAAAADHVIYGWLFFSVVIVLLILAGLPFRQDIGPRRPVAPAAVRPAGRPPWLAAAVLAAAAALGPVAATAIDRGAAPPAAVTLPRFAAAAGCAPAGEAADAQHFTCGGLPLVAAIRVFPVRSNPGDLLAAMRVATGEDRAEDTATDRHADWRLVETEKPDGVAASLLLIDGEPSSGGLRARLGQARHSLFGGAAAPVLATVALGGGQPLERPRRQAARQVLQAFLDAQPGFAAALAQAAAAAAK